MSDSLRKRIMTAVVLGGTALIVLFVLPQVWTVVLLTGWLLIGAWEWSAFLRVRSVLTRYAYVALVAVLLAGAFVISATPQGREAVLATGVLWWLGALAWIVFAPRYVSTWSAALAGVLALVPAWLALVRLRLDPPDGAEWVLFALILVWVADIGAFFFGKRFGRVRLAPHISPGKTWEGVAGGVAVSVIVAIAGSLWFHVPLHRFLPLCLAVVAFSIVGDLTESLLKRFAGIKDSGTLLPGHGGVMDRIDSVTGAAPVLLLGLTILGVVA